MTKQMFQALPLIAIALGLISAFFIAVGKDQEREKGRKS